MRKVKFKLFDGEEEKISKMLQNPRIKVLFISNFGLRGYTVWYEEKTNNGK